MSQALRKDAPAGDSEYVRVIDNLDDIATLCGVSLEPTSDSVDVVVGDNIVSMPYRNQTVGIYGFTHHVVKNYCMIPINRLSESYARFVDEAQKVVGLNDLLFVGMDQNNLSQQDVQIVENRWYELGVVFLMHHHAGEKMDFKYALANIIIDNKSCQNVNKKRIFVESDEDQSKVNDSGVYSIINKSPKNYETGYGAVKKGNDNPILDARLVL